MPIQKVTEKIVHLKNIKSFSVIGDPGCEGLGTTMMQVYANALECASQDDFILIAGDLVPEGTDRFYKAITGLTNAITNNAVYALRGNHDTGEYDEHFGYHNYAIVCDEFTMIVLDNAFRKFEEEGLILLKDVLSRDDCKNAIVAFHIPLPNNFTGNAVSAEEFSRLKKVYTPWKNKIKYFVCGHVHSRFIDTVDDIPFICTGGGGAVIEDISGSIRASDINHHIIRFFCTGTSLDYSVVDLCKTFYTKENEEQVMSGKLAEAVQGEMLAYLTYKTFSERANARGLCKVANLFEALAESEYRHAKNFYSITEHLKPFVNKINDFIKVEEFEYKQLYNMMRDYAKDRDLPLSRQAYAAAAYAENTHAALLKEANNLQKFDTDKIYVCPVCGCLMTEKDKTSRCPLCGAPEKDFLVFSC